MREVTIYGSCVSRDVFNVPNEELQMRAYFARSSFISAVSSPSQLPTRKSMLTSPFQQRMLEQDITSRVLPQLASLTDQIFLVDLIDERGGVLELEGGGFITDLSELRHSGWRKLLRSVRKHSLGEESHLKLFREAIEPVLDATGAPETIVIKSRFAEFTDQGQPVPDYAGASSARWNELYEPYFSLLEESGLQILDVPGELCIADSEHQWGVAPYHYIPEFYRWVANQLSSFSSLD